MADYDYIVPSDLQEVRNLCKEGNKGAAIKKFREVTGVGLREAKAFVEYEVTLGDLGLRTTRTKAEVLMDILHHSSRLSDLHNELEGIED